MINDAQNMFINTKTYTLGVIFAVLTVAALFFSGALFVDVENKTISFAHTPEAQAFAGGGGDGAGGAGDGGDGGPDTSGFAGGGGDGCGGCGDGGGDAAPAPEPTSDTDDGFAGGGGDGCGGCGSGGDADGFAGGGGDAGASPGESPSPDIPDDGGGNGGGGDDDDDDDNGGGDDDDNGNNDDDDGNGGGPARPRCLFLDITEVHSDGDITLSWGTRRAEEIRIEPDIFETDDEDEMREGSVRVRGDEDEYTLIVERGSREDECVVEFNDDDIVVLSERDRLPLVVSLTDIPQTGFEAGPFLTSLFYALIAFLSFGIAYVAVSRREMILARVFGTARDDDEGDSLSGGMLPHDEYQAHRDGEVFVDEETVEHPFVGEDPAYVTSASAPVNLPTGTFESALAEAPNNGLHILEEEAHKRSALLSSDAIRMIEDRATGRDEQIALLHDIIDRAKESFPREHGWLVVNRERINDMFHDAPATPGSGEVAMPQEAETHASDDATPRTSNTHTSFVGAVLEGDLPNAYRHMGGEPLLAIAEAVEALDAVYRYRKGMTQTRNDELIRQSEHLRDDQIEALIDVLTSAIDGTYKNEHSAAKIAILKAVKVVAS